MLPSGNCIKSDCFHSRLLEEIETVTVLTIEERPGTGILALGKDSQQTAAGCATQ